ncbi:hypothetical protein HXA34_02755 [Salipaludibacillus agaradhaerens]|uniref:hypothetical protein n=1 Tax=Salipaludibacillus agaradhaerens TaxID=76935 RepID=UPI002150A969|nr:hypothetical protein [Salipaludibacillus agaradhaerens]MCR6105207.1 hypothetical protein [Salipaludibacillus agaradhaerens]MCR6117252.1 hypothetical protein [Salipaludibacillus agaradhaerens]
MKEYTVRPNKDADAWFLKIEDVAPEKDFDKAKLQSVGVFFHPPLIVSLTYRTFRGSLSPT